MSVVLLIISYWNSCSKRSSDKKASIDRVIEAGKAIRSRSNSYDKNSSDNLYQSNKSSRTNSNDNVSTSNRALRASDMNLLHQKLSNLPNNNNVRKVHLDEEDAELEGLLGHAHVDHRRRPLCRENITPFMSAANSRAPSAVNSRAASPVQHKRSYGSIEDNMV